MLVSAVQQSDSVTYTHIYFGCSDDKESTCNVGDPDLTPGSGRFPEGGNSSPL